MNSFAQTKTDAISIFKMQCFLDAKNNSSRYISSKIIKNDSLYNDFNNKTEFSLESLNVIFTKSLTFSNKFNFYVISEFLKNKNSIISVYTKKHILAINPITGMSYRLLGFNGNDFLSFLSDFKEEYKEAFNRNISTSEFLKNYKVEGLDFECLYKGLKSDERDIKKYPCLIRVSDPIWIK